jgi:hypothetical protein
VAREALMVVGQHEGGSIEVGARRFLLAVSAGQDELAQQYGLQLAETEFSVPTVPESNAEELWNSLALNRGP